MILCTDGDPQLDEDLRERLSRHGVPIREDRIARLEGVRGALESIVFTNGEALPRRSIFFTTGQDHSCDLVNQLGCVFTDKGAVETNTLEGTNIPGLYVAGDASKDVQLVIVAAAEGAKAGFAINSALQEEEFG